MIGDGLSSSIKETGIDYDYIVSPEPGGNQWGVLVSYLVGKRLNVLRATDMPGSVLSIERRSVYSSGRLYFKGIKPNDNVIIVDDVISSGNTLKSILEGLNHLGCRVSLVQVIAVNGEEYKRTLKDYSVPVKYLIKT